jgi:hypothetical protein
MNSWSLGGGTFVDRIHWSCIYHPDALDFEIAGGRIFLLVQLGVSVSGVIDCDELCPDHKEISISFCPGH